MSEQAYFSQKEGNTKYESRYNKRVKVTLADDTVVMLPIVGIMHSYQQAVTQSNNLIALDAKLRHSAIADCRFYTYQPWLYMLAIDYDFEHDDTLIPVRESDLMNETIANGVYKFYTDVFNSHGAKA